MFLVKLFWPNSGRCPLSSLVGFGLVKAGVVPGSTTARSCQAFWQERVPLMLIRPPGQGAWAAFARSGW